MCTLSACALGPCALSSSTLSSCALGSCALTTCTLGSCTLSSSTLSSCALGSCTLTTCALTTCALCVYIYWISHGFLLPLYFESLKESSDLKTIYGSNLIARSKGFPHIFYFDFFILLYRTE
ncbi:MAG: pentapeptide repeat-containing protein [Clostridiales bacterium]|nr:pentapeptide repeat-containing protein [Clostridiales bacterium]